MTGRASYALALCLAVCAAGCPDKTPRRAAPDARADAHVVARDASASSADAGDGGEDAAAEAEPPPDPQDGERPPDATLAELDARMRHLVEAIAQNNPDLAQDVLFPKAAFAATFDTKDAHRDWTRKVRKPFKKSIDRTHKKAKGAAHARFAEFKLGSPVFEATAKKGELKRSLWRVKHSRLKIVIDGKTQQIDVAEMTSWRGNWYVTRLR